MSNEIRLGFVGIVIEKKDRIQDVNRILSSFSEIIRGRIGIPNPEDQSAVIGIIVEGRNEQVGALTGKLGNLPGITVKSALAGKKERIE